MCTCICPSVVLPLAFRIDCRLRVHMHRRQGIDEIDVDANINTQSAFLPNRALSAVSWSACRAQRRSHDQFVPEPPGGAYGPSGFSIDNQGPDGKTDVRNAQRLDTHPTAPNVHTS